MGRSMCTSSVSAGQSYAFLRRNRQLRRPVYADMHLSNAAQSLRLSFARGARGRFLKVPKSFPLAHSKFAGATISTFGHSLPTCCASSKSFASAQCDLLHFGTRPRNSSLASQRQPWRLAATTTTQNLSTDAGEIHVIFGPMFAGKTTALLERIAEDEAKGKTVTLVKSSKDCRYSEDKIVSHDGTARQCTSVFCLEDLRGVIGEERWTNTDVIAIDEAQFIPDLVSFCVPWLMSIIRKSSSQDLTVTSNVDDSGKSLTCSPFVTPLQSSQLSAEYVRHGLHFFRCGQYWGRARKNWSAVPMRTNRHVGRAT